jgi:hypothetical protein
MISSALILSVFSLLGMILFLWVKLVRHDRYIRQIGERHDKEHQRVTEIENRLNSIMPNRWR